MQDPAKEISEVVSLITAAVNPEIQKAAVLRFYAPNAEFKHPLCHVPADPMSRNNILGILQWYRQLSPALKIKTNNVTYNENSKELFVDVTQEFHIRWSPFRPAPSRLIVHLTLRPSDSDPELLVIAHHEDFYHPDDFMALLLPPLLPIIRLGLRCGTLASIINAHIFSRLGYWSLENGGRGVDLVTPTSSDDSQDRPKIN